VHGAGRRGAAAAPAPRRTRGGRVEQLRLALLALVTIVATGYIVGRGIAKAGVGHLPIGVFRRKPRACSSRTTQRQPVVASTVTAFS
jgi:hypothetical protein